jgi:Glycosyltransferase
MNKIKILMCGPKLNVKGGMVSVIKNYLSHPNWGEFEIEFIPTYTEKNKVIIAVYFVVAYIKVVLSAIFGHYDILYVHAAERGSFYRKSLLVRILRKIGIKTVIHHHAAEFEQFYANSSDKKKKYINETLELADLNIVLSNRLVGMITNKAPKANVAVLYNAVNTYKTNPYNINAHNVLFLGRLGDRKGTFDLLKTIKELDLLLDDNVKFYLCGDGDVNGVTEKVKEYGIEHRIAHIGWIDGKQKMDFMKCTMINVLPSYNEGLPMTILETMAYGIPNISTNIASIPEVIENGENGYMITPGDIEELKRYLTVLCADKDLRIDLSKRSWADMTERFAIDAHINQLKEYLHELF